LKPQIEGVVLDQAGNPVHKARVRVIPGDKALQKKRAETAWSDSEGLFSFWNLDHGEYRLFAEHEDFAHSDFFGPIEVTERGSVNNLTFVLEKGVCIFGTVQDSAGNIIPDARIDCKGLSLEGYVLDYDEGGNLGSCRSHDTGEYVIDHAKIGKVRISGL
jgi:hypothetical protein